MSKSKIVHLDKFMKGEKTPQQVHRQVAFAGRTCDKCGGPPAMRVRLFAEFRELHIRSPQWVMMEAAKHDGKLPMVQFKYGDFVKVSDAVACEQCSTELEKEAAKAPSWVIVEFDKGPTEGVSLQVPRAFEKAKVVEATDGAGSI